MNMGHPREPLTKLRILNTFSAHTSSDVSTSAHQRGRKAAHRKSDHGFLAEERIRK